MHQSSAPLTAIYRVNAGHAPSDSWVNDLAVGGGRILGEVCHFVDSLLALVGAPITGVYASGHGRVELPLQARDNLAVTLTFADSSTGSILYVADGSSRLPKERLEAFCGPRTAVLDDYRTVELFGPEGSRHVGEGDQDKGHRAEIAAFIASVRHGSQPVALAEVANASYATLAIVESLRIGLPVALAS